MNLKDFVKVIRWMLKTEILIIIIIKFNEMLKIILIVINQVLDLFIENIIEILKLDNVANSISYYQEFKLAEITLMR